MRKKYSSGAEWEQEVGYSRAVRIGNILEISGTTSIENGVFVYPNDAYAQTKQIIKIAQSVLIQAGGTLKDVIRTRMYVTDISLWKEVGKAHGDFFKDIKPATTMVEVSALIDPQMLVEIEFTAYLAD